MGYGTTISMDSIGFQWILLYLAKWKCSELSELSGLSGLSGHVTIVRDAPTSQLMGVFSPWLYPFVTSTASPGYDESHVCGCLKIGCHKALYLNTI
jgi:hypothetical protein